MYKVKVLAHFSGAHNLRGYKGKCEDLHGHNWRVEVIAKSEKLNALGMVVDFTELKGAVNGCLEELDHKYLNDIEYFKENNPTSENMAKYVYERVSEIEPDIELDSVTVWETETASAEYRP